MATKTRETTSAAKRREQSTRHDPAPVTGGPDPQPGEETGHHGGRAAAETATRRNSVQANLPIVGRVGLPARDELAFLGGVGALAVIGVIEWPIAALLGAGHVLAAKRRNKVVHEFGEALETV